MKELPKALLDELRSIKGFDENSFIASHQQSAGTSIRLHKIKKLPDFDAHQQVPWCAQGRYLQQRPVFTLDPDYHAGAYYVQEASSMFLDYLVKAILPERNNLRILDLCAAPGGKTTLLASLLGENSLLISNEVIRSRASLLEENAVRWGYTNTWVTSNDPKEFGKLDGYFDLIVVDAPCSGSGLFRKDEKALTEWSEANVQLCNQRQQRIIADVWDSLKEDGVLIYATCSYSPQEDEAILDWMANELEVETISINFPQEWGIVIAQSERQLTGYRFFPDKIQGEGFFIAAVRKKQNTKSIYLNKFKSLHQQKILDQVNFLLKEKAWSIIQDREKLVAIDTDHEYDFQLLSKYLYFRKVGLSIGMPTAKEWVPAHDIALSIDKSENIPSINLNKEQALKFLKKEDFEIPENEKGWRLITYNGLGLGWIKMLGNRYNNYLPKNWRIRMEIPDEF